LPAILFLGIITSYEDIKSGKIRNKWIMSALIYAVLVNVVLVLFYPSKNGIHLPYLIELTTNSLFSVVLGFGLWYLGIWTAGDGKLTLLCSL